MEEKKRDLETQIQHRSEAVDFKVKLSNKSSFYKYRN